MCAFEVKGVTSGEVTEVKKIAHMPLLGTRDNLFFTLVILDLRQHAVAGR